MFRIILIVLVLVGCNSLNPAAENSNKPKAGGAPGEIILVMDSAHWDSKLGTVLKEVFFSKTPGLPRPETLFTVRYIKPLDFRSILKYAKNIVIVYDLENDSQGSRRIKSFFTVNSLDVIAHDTTKFLLSKSDEWASGQEVMFLYGQNEQILSNLIERNKIKIQQHFNNLENQRLSKALFSSNEMKGVSSLLSTNHEFSLRIPFGWRIEYEKQTENFIWLRNPGLEADKNIWIHYSNYNGPIDFENTINLRNDVTREYIYDDKEANDTSFVVVETFIPPIITDVNFLGQYAKKIIGLWKTNNLSMGGPFLSYVFADPLNGRLYIIDGFIYSPSKPQREYMREIDTILKTFSTKAK